MNKTVVVVVALFTQKIQSLLSFTSIIFRKFAASIGLDHRLSVVRVVGFPGQLNRWRTSCGVELHVGQMLATSGFILDM